MAPRLSRKFQDQVIQSPRTDGIEACRGLVEKEDVGIERHGAGQTSALAHSATDLRGIEVLKTGKPYQRKFQRYQSLISLELRSVY